MKQNIRLVPIEPDAKRADLLAKTAHCKCDFCKKRSEFDSFSFEICERMSGEGFYCPFCLRHGYDKKSNRHVLVLSFRAISGYLFYNFHKSKKEMWISELRDQLNKHEIVGMSNPAFNYDPESLSWFVDFSKVGKGKKVKLSEVLYTVDLIISCFDLEKRISANSVQTLKNKFKDAIEKFHSKRYRPENRPQLIPTIPLVPSIKYESDFLRDFSSNHLKINL